MDETAVLAMLFGSFIFFGVMIPTVLITAAPATTIRLMELCGLYDKGALKIARRDMLTGSGHYRKSRVYLTTRGGVEMFVSANVFGYLVLIFVPLCLVLALIVALQQGLLY